MTRTEELFGELVDGCSVSVQYKDFEPFESDIRRDDDGQRFLLDGGATWAWYDLVNDGTIKISVLTPTK